MELKQVLDIAVELGYYMLRSGGEIYRVEQSVQYVCKAYGVTEVDVFAIPATMVVTVSDGTNYETKTRRAGFHTTNMDQVERLAALSRTICEKKPGYREVKEELERIRRRPGYPPLIQYLGNILIAASFTLFFGGSVTDSLAAAGITALITVLGRYLRRLHANPFFVNLLSGFFTGLAAYILSAAAVWFQADKIVIGVIMILVPGVAIANSIRDFLSSDTIAGLSRLAEALLTAVGIAIGVALAMVLVS